MTHPSVLLHSRVTLLSLPSVLCVYLGASPARSTVSLGAPAPPLWRWPLRGGGFAPAPAQLRAAAPPHRRAGGGPSAEGTLLSRQLNCEPRRARTATPAVAPPRRGLCSRAGSTASRGAPAPPRWRWPLPEGALLSRQPNCEPRCERVPVLGHSEIIDSSSRTLQHAAATCRRWRTRARRRLLMVRMRLTPRLLGHAGPRARCVAP